MSDEFQIEALDEFGLDRLELEIGRQRCKLNGHPSWSPIVSFGVGEPVAFICDRCGLSVATALEQPGGFNARA